MPLIMVVLQEGHAEPGRGGTTHGLSGTSAPSSAHPRSEVLLIRSSRDAVGLLDAWDGEPHLTPCLASYWDLPPDLMSLGTA